MNKSIDIFDQDLTKSENQISILQTSELKPFQESLRDFNLFPLFPTNLEVFQINLGKMCNQICKHCHVDAGPTRTEIMTRETMLLCLETIKKTAVLTVDLTGGAPEMNPNFRWFVEELSKLGKKIIVRCNLTIILANKKFYDLPEFFKKHQVEVVSSLPYFSAFKTDAQRGNGVFEKSIEALKRLNSVGYGIENSGLNLNLVYNPSGAFMPPTQESLEKEFKQKLKTGFNIEFNSLFTITNLPVSRFLNYLVISGNYNAYMEKLLNAFNPSAAKNVMCRTMISVSWDGFLYDCDFNQMLDLKVTTKSKHLKEFNLNELKNRNIVVSQHCYACAAGSGSSCGGTVV
jgi:radical SAM/Cys-rich protein